MQVATRRAIFVAVGFAAALAGYPMASTTVHGFNIGVWPAVAITPYAWLWAIAHSYGLLNAQVYLDMICGVSGGFSGGGYWQVLAIFLTPTLITAWLLPASSRSFRDPRGTFGDARWANEKEKSQMNEGIELGIDPDNGRPIRVQFEGNLLTIAPPRTGKTSGLAIPNLLVPSDEAWIGPAIVIDPKGQIFQAAAERRSTLGRRAVVLDPANIVGGADTWCPVQGVDGSDILRLQRIARALLPAPTSAESAYFNNRAVPVIVTAIRAALNSDEQTPAAIARLLDNPNELANNLGGLDDTITQRVRTLLAMESRTRDPVLSTAGQAFQWCDDTRMQNLTTKSSF